MESIVIAIIGSSALSAVVSGVFNMLTIKSTLKKALQLLLLGEMERLSGKYIQLGKVSRKELKWFLDLYDVYKKLGGDGYADDMKSDVCKLPVDIV